MKSKINYAIKGKNPIVEKFSFVDFKKVKPIKINEFKSDSVRWKSIYELINPLTIEEANLEYDYDWGYLEYLFVKKYEKTPFIYLVDENAYDKSFIADFFNFVDPPIKSYKLKKSYDEKGLTVDKFVLLVEDEFLFHYDGRSLSFFISPEKALQDGLFNKFLGMLSPYVKLKHQENKIYVVYRADYGFDKKGFDVKQRNVNIDLNYNDDFKETSEYIITNLNDKNKTGLYVLEGEPGTGKTTYIRHLASKIKRNIIFISPDMVDHITDPSFIPFLMNNSDSVLIIEDAEPALQKRNGSSRTSAISNILNLTDGLLSDCLNISIVATFNTNTKELDEALLRGGRLVKSYTFKKLVKEKATKLLNSLGHDVKADKDMSLAEIYFYGEDNNADTFKNKKIGFGN